jgi:hypothetical protein
MKLCPGRTPNDNNGNIVFNEVLYLKHGKGWNTKKLCDVMRNVAPDSQ